MEGKWIRQPASGVSIVFVHGILSDGIACWQNDNGAYWPDLLKSERSLEGLGIYVFTYQTGIFSGTYSLSDAVDSMKEHLRIDKVSPCQCLIFVCHSMGGLVVRKFLVERSIELIEEKTIVGLFMIASPSLGSDYASWLSPIARLLNHTQADALHFVESNLWLSGLDKEFKNLKEAGRLSLSGKELVEDKFVTLQKLWRKQVVAPFSGAVYFGEPYKVPGSDHFSIAKPASNSDIQNRLLVQFTEGLLEGINIDKEIASKASKHPEDISVDLLSVMKAIQKQLLKTKQTRIPNAIATDFIANEMRISSEEAIALVQTLIDKRFLTTVSGQRIELTTSGLHFALQKEQT